MMHNKSVPMVKYLDIRKTGLFLLYFLIIAIITIFILSDTQAQTNTQVSIETEILPFDTQSGLKSKQTLSIDFNRKSITPKFETGVTNFNIPGVTDTDILKLRSVRDNFNVRNVSFSKDKVSFIATGETASGIRLLPNINYNFEFTIWKDGRSIVRGCHDGYPAYRIMISGEERYFYEHAPKDVVKLIGECDIFLPSPQNDHALTIQSTQIVPDGPGTGAMILEASSIHSAIRLYYENPRQRRTEGAVYAVMPVNGKNELPKYAVARRVLEQAFAGEGAFGRVTSSVIKGQFTSLRQPLKLPAADFRFIIRADSSVLKEIDRVLESKLDQIQNSLNPKNYNSVMLATAKLLQNAVSAAPGGELQIIVNSKGTRQLLPKTSEQKSGLSWLFSYALQSEGHSRLAGCGLTANKPANDLLTQYFQLLDTANETHLATVGLIGLVDGGFGYRLFAADISLRIAHLLLTSIEADRYSEFLALGHFDPTRVDIAKCKGIRLLRGETDPIAHVIERSEIYRTASELISQSRSEKGIRPLFFDAASSVTRLIGVGLVDLADDMRLYQDTFLVKASRDIFVSDVCFPTSAEILPNPDDRAFLRKVNAELLTFNQPRMQRLVQSPKLLFDPVSFGPLDVPARYKDFPALWFDLRMVQAEQGHVEQLVRKAGISAGSMKDKALTTAELALRCLATGRTAYLLDAIGQKSPHLKIITNVDKALSKLKEAGVIASQDQMFSNETWRIAIGSAFVFALHRHKALTEADWLDEYVSHIKRLMASKSIVRSDIPRILQNQIDGILLGAEQRWPEARIIGITNATMTYLTELQSLSFYKCEGLAPVRSLSSDTKIPSIIPTSQLVQNLKKLGIQTIALPYELKAEDGALQSNLLLSAVNDRERFCQALEARYIALQCAASTSPSGDCDASALQLPDRSDGAARFLFMKASINLREDLGHLQAFLFDELKPLSYVPTFLEVESAVRSAVERERIYRRNLALVAVLAKQSAAIRQALGVETDDEFWKTLLTEAFPKHHGAVVIDGDIDSKNLKKLREDLSISAELKRISALEEKLIKAVRSVTISPESKENINEFGDIKNADRVATGTEDASTLSKLAALGNNELGLGFELHPIASEADGIAKFRGVLIYQRASTTTGAAACMGSDAKPCSASSGIGSKVPLDLSRERGRLALGLELSPLVFDEFGDLKISSTLGKADIVHRPEQTRAALYALGMPRSIGLDAVQFDLGPELKSIMMLVDLELASLPNFQVPIPVMENGKMVDFEEVARDAVETAASDWLRTQSELLTFDANLSPSSTLPIGLSLKKGSLVPIIDWNGGTVAADAKFDFYIGSGTNRQVFLAEAAITISSEVADLHRLTFNLVDPKALEKAIKQVHPFSELVSIAEHVSILPEFAGGNLSLLIRAMPRIEGCALPVEQRINLSDPEFGLKALKDSVTSTALDLAKCQVERQVGALFQELSGGKINIFGLQMKFEFEKLLVGNKLADGRIVVPVEFPKAQFEGCKESSKPSTFILPNFALNLNTSANSFGIDLGGLGREERNTLGSALQCKIENSLGDLSGALRVSNVEIGRDIMAADIMVPNLPFIGDLILPRINFFELDRDLSDILDEQLKAQAGAKIRSLIADLAGDKIEVPGVGAFKPNWDTASFDLFTSKQIIIPGRMLFANKYDIGVELILPLIGSNISGFKIRPTEDPGSLIAGQLSGLLSGMLPFPGPIKLIAPRVAQLDDRGFRWGLVFGMKIDLDLAGQGFKITLNRIAISADGIDMDQEIRMAMNTPMYFGPVALSQIIVIYKTGADGGSKGLSIGADLTAVEPSLANILKIEAILDLRDAHLPKFVLEGDLIAFDSIALLESHGEINLNKQLVSFEAATTDAIRDIIDAAADGKIDGEEKLVMASTKIAILGIDLQQTEMHFCTKSCDPTFPDGGSAKLKTSHDFLFGPKAQLEFQTDLEFRNPSLGAGVGLNLFGWEPGHAHVSANKKLSRLELDFLGIEVGITTPTLKLLSPGYITDVLLSLLDIDLLALLKLPPDKIEISLMQGDGSTQTVADGSNNDSSEGTSEGDAESSDDSRESVPPGKKSGPGPTQNPIIAKGLEKGEENSTGPNQPFWGTSVDGIFCEEVASPLPNGPPSAREIQPRDRYQIWARNFSDPSEAPSPLFFGHPHAMPTWHSPTFSGYMANVICHLKGNQLLLREDILNVGVARVPIGTSKSCEDHIPEFRYYRLNSNNEEHKKRFTNAQRSILCYKTKSGRFDVEARLFWRNSDNKYLAVLYCPSVTDKIRTELSSLPGYIEACGESAEVFVLDNPSNCKSTCTILNDITELKLIEDRLRGFLLSGAPLDLSYDILDEDNFDYGGARVDLRQLPVIGRSGTVAAHRFELGIETEQSGILQIENLRLTKPAKDESGLWPWVQPNRAGIRNEILKRWLANGRRPSVIASFPDDGWLVLRLSSKRDSEVQLWLEDQGQEIPNFIEIVAPTRPPLGAAAFANERRQQWLAGLLTLVKRLPREQTKWNLSLGVAEESEILNYSFRAVGASELEPDLMVHLHSYDPAGKSVWVGGNSSPAKTICTQSRVFEEELRQSAIESKRNEVALENALIDLDTFSQEMGLGQHAIGILTSLGECNG